MTVMNESYFDPVGVREKATSQHEHVAVHMSVETHWALLNHLAKFEGTGWSQQTHVGEEYCKRG